MNFSRAPTPWLHRTRSLPSSGERSNPYRPLKSNQCLYRFDGSNTWRSLPMPLLSPEIFSSQQAIPCFRIITWNIEFSAPLIAQRTTGILDYIQECILASLTQAIGIPTVLLFQEVHEEAFEAILYHPFIQNYYDLTDISTRRFSSSYGTITCVPRSLTAFVTAVNRIKFRNSRFGRDALTVDLNLPYLPKSRHSFPCQLPISHIRICNTHLESLRGRGDLARPEQLRLISRLLHSADGGLVGGDMNAIIPTDDQVPSTLGLIDAWEAIHPQGAAEAGHTWGYQPPSRRHPPGRLDKVLHSGRLTPVSIERFGVGQTIEHKWDDVWFSDHYGLIAQFTIR